MRETSWAHRRSSTASSKAFETDEDEERVNLATVFHRYKPISIERTEGVPATDVSVGGESQFQIPADDAVSKPTVNPLGGSSVIKSGDSGSVGRRPGIVDGEEYLLCNSGTADDAASRAKSSASLAAKNAKPSSSSSGIKSSQKAAKVADKGIMSSNRSLADRSPAIGAEGEGYQNYNSNSCTERSLQEDDASTRTQTSALGVSSVGIYSEVDRRLSLSGRQPEDVRRTRSPDSGTRCSPEIDTSLSLLRDENTISPRATIQFAKRSPNTIFPPDIADAIISTFLGEHRL